MTKKLSLGTILLATLLSSTYSSTLKNTVSQTITTNSEIMSNKLKIESKYKEIEIEKSGYYPKVDFDAFIEKSQLKNNRDSTGSESWFKKDGYNLKLSAEQLLYNGDKTNSKVREKEFNYTSNVYKYDEKNELVVLDIIKAYLSLVKYYELDQVMDYRIRAHNKSLEIAYNKEEISGETLETLKTLSLISVQDDKKYEQKIRKERVIAKYENLTSLKMFGNFCRPVTDETKLPQTLEEMIQLALENNYKIKEQKEIIKVQKEKISQSDSNFKPTAKLHLSASQDDDLELAEDGTQKELVGQVKLNWNFYSGGRDESTTQKEKIVLNEEKKTLEKLQNDLIEKITILYYQRIETKKRIMNFQKSINTNNEILKITNNQLEDGTKTFIDVLQAKIKLLDAQDNKINQEFILLQNYYEILKELSIVTSTIIQSDDQTCNNKIIPDLTKDEIVNDKEINDLLDETPEIVLEETPVVTQEAIAEVETLEDLVEKSIGKSNKNDFTFVKDEMKITIPVTMSSFSKKSLNPYNKFKFLLDSFSPKLLKVISQHKDEIKYIEITGHTSSEYSQYADVPNHIEREYEANMKLSQIRADKTKQYLVKKAIKEDLDPEWLSSHLKTRAKGSQELIKYNDGIEDKVNSRRIEIKITKK